MHAVTKPFVEHYREPAAFRIETIEQCLAPNCAIRIEHAARLGPRNCQWQRWQEPRMHDGQAWRICEDIDRCRAEYGDHYIRLCIENFAFRSQVSMLVYEPYGDP